MENAKKQEVGSAVEHNFLDGLKQLFLYGDKPKAIKDYEKIVDLDLKDWTYQDADEFQKWFDKNSVPPKLVAFKRTIEKRFPAVDVEKAILASINSSIHTAVDLHNIKETIRRGRVKEFLLDTGGELWYILEGHVAGDRILHKYDTITMLKGGGAALVWIEGDEILISEYKYDRDSLRGKHLWTIDTPLY